MDHDQRGTPPSVVAVAPLEEYCPSCGGWVSYLHFDHESGWCKQCVGLNDDQARCTRCGTVLPANHGRSTCHTCRQERWLERYMDELEYLVVAKGYSVHQARMAIEMAHSFTSQTRTRRAMLLTQGTCVSSSPA
jgi:hypothetical protein